MYKVKRGTVKVDGKDYVPGQILPEIDQDDVESLLAEKLIEETPAESFQNSSTEEAFQKIRDGISGNNIPVNDGFNPTFAITEDSINGYAKSLEDNAILKVAGDEQVESVIPEAEVEEENFEAAGDFSVDFNIDDYVAEPEKEVEEKPKDEPEHKKAAHKKGGK